MCLCFTGDGGFELDLGDALGPGKPVGKVSDMNVICGSTQI